VRLHRHRRIRTTRTVPVVVARKSSWGNIEKMGMKYFRAFSRGLLGSRDVLENLYDPWGGLAKIAHVSPARRRVRGALHPNAQPMGFHG